MMMKGTTDPEQIQRYKEQIEVIKNQPEINIGLAKLSKTPLEEKSEPKQKTLMELLSGHQKNPEEKKEEMKEEKKLSKETKEKILKEFEKKKPNQEEEIEPIVTIKRSGPGRPSTLTDDDKRKYLSKKDYKEMIYLENAYFNKEFTTKSTQHEKLKEFRKQINSNKKAGIGIV